MPNLISATSFFLSADPASTLSPPALPALSLLAPPTLHKLRTLGTPRIRDMLQRTHGRGHGMAFQVLSSLPVAVSPGTCRRLNDSLAAHIGVHHDRFAGLALLSAWDGDEAGRELARCVGRMGFVGGVVVVGREGEGEGWAKDMDPIWRVAERFNVPVVLRMVFPTCGQVAQHELLCPRKSPHLQSVLAGLHPAYPASPLPVLALYTSGTFDRFPRLKILLAANGHSIPMLLSRIDALLPAPPSRPPG